MSLSSRVYVVSERVGVVSPPVDLEIGQRRYDTVWPPVPRLNVNGTSKVPHAVGVVVLPIWTMPVVAPPLPRVILFELMRLPETNLMAPTVMFDTAGLIVNPRSAWMAKLVIGAVATPVPW